MKDEVTGRSMNMWLMSGMIPAILSVSGRSGWLGVLPAALVGGLLCAAVRVYATGKLPRWLQIIELVWLVVFSGMVARESAACWQGESVVTAIILLFLAAYSSGGGVVSASRTGAVLAWLIHPVLGIVVLSGMTDFAPQWVSAEWEMPEGTLVSLLLLPCLVVFLPVKGGGKARWVPWLPGLVAFAAAVVLEGTMGRRIAGNGFYEFSKGITVLGVAERFEALVASALTLGWFALFTMIFTAARHMIKEIYSPAASYGPWLCAAISAGLMCIMPENGEWLSVGTLIFWGFLPLLTQGLVGRKKVVKK